MFTPARMCLNEFVQVGRCGGNAYSATEWAILYIYIYIVYNTIYIYTVYDGHILRMLLSDVCFTKWQNDAKRRIWTKRHVHVMSFLVQ